MKIRGQVVYSIGPGAEVCLREKAFRRIGASWEAHFGPVPDGLYVCHKCDNRSCINPEHLFLGTHQDNVDDRELKGRNKLVHLKHEAHPNSLLTADAVKEIRLRGRNGYRELAKKYGVSDRTVRDVLNCKTWRPVSPEETK